MSTFRSLLDLACGEAPPQEEGRARRLQLVVFGILSALLFSGLWGLAAGSSSTQLALGNLYKVPMVLLLSTLSAVPAGLLAARLSGTRMRGSDLLLSFTTGVFGGSLVLAVLAPLVALYYHSSAWAGPMLGIGSAVGAIGVATVIFFRAVFRRAPSRSAAMVPALVLLGMQLMTLLQFIAIASPILPEKTVFDGGIDHVVQH